MRFKRADLRPEKADLGSERADLGPERGLGRGGTDVRTDGRLEIHPCVLQDIGPLGPLPKKVSDHWNLVAYLVDESPTNLYDCKTFPQTQARRGIMISLQTGGQGRTPPPLLPHPTHMHTPTIPTTLSCICVFNSIITD